MQTRSSSAASTATAQASMSNMPPTTGVPAFRPVSAGCLFGNPAADIRRKPQGRQCAASRLQPEKSEQPRIVVPRMQVHQVRARIIRHLGESFARQAEPDVILALEHPADIAVVLRLVVPQPRQQGHG